MRKFVCDLKKSNSLVVLRCSKLNTLVVPKTLEDGALVRSVLVKKGGEVVSEVGRRD